MTEHEKPMTKKSNPGPASGIRRSITILALFLVTLVLHAPTQAAPLSEASNPVPAAAMKLVQSCMDPKVALDSQAIATLVDYVLEPKPKREADLPKLWKASGAYYEFDTRIDFPSFLKYSFSRQIPSVLTSPSSLRYSQWIDQGNSRRISNISDLSPSEGQPIVLRGLEHVGITPDLNTGVYYQYDLKKTLILLKHKGRQVLISVSKQADISDVGKKGFILGKDDDWNYHYSGEPGSAKAGLGWVKSYIYDYFSVGVYVSTGSSPPAVRSGFFSWIRAGWSGVNFAEPRHVLKGLQRHARSSKSVLESPRLPAPSQVASSYLKLSALPRNVLADRYAALQQARQQLAARKGNAGNASANRAETVANIPREQILSELMLEYFKTTLGKPSLLESRGI